MVPTVGDTVSTVGEIWHVVRLNVVRSYGGRQWAMMVGGERAMRCECALDLFDSGRGAGASALPQFPCSDSLVLNSSLVFYLLTRIHRLNSFG